MIKDYIDELHRCLDSIESQSEKILEIVDILKTTKKELNRVFICGNGGSSSTASHMVNDLVKMCGINATCLSDNVPLVTAIANDVDYEHIFSNQLLNLSNMYDTLIVISGSGNSPNIIEAIRYCKQCTGMKIIAFVGQDGGYVAHMDGIHLIHIPTDMLHAEDCHLILEHIISTEIKNGNK